MKQFKYFWVLVSLMQSLRVTAGHGGCVPEPLPPPHRPLRLPGGKLTRALLARTLDTSSGHHKVLSVSLGESFLQNKTKDNPVIFSNVPRTLLSLIFSVYRHSFSCFNLFLCSFMKIACLRRFFFKIMTISVHNLRSYNL